MTWKTTTEYITVTGAGESIYTAGDKFNTYLTNLSSAWFAFTYQYVDSRAQQVLNIPFSKLDSTVVDYLTGTYYFDTANETNLVMDKLYQLPEDKQRLMYYDLWDRELYPQKPGINDAVRCLYYNGFAGLYSFANNKVLSDSYSDFTGVIGNVYYEDQTVDIVTNGVIYNYSEEKFKPGEVYYLTDLMDGWMIPYQEGGDGQLVSVPMAVAVHENSAILLTERGMTKDLPCFPECPPTRLRFYETAIDYTTPEPVVCDNVKLLVSSENINQSGKIYSSGTPAALSINTGDVVSSTSQTIVGNTSLMFPGLEDDYIQFKNTSTYNLSSDPFSIEFWVWFDDASRHDFIMGVWDSSLRRKGWMIESPSDSSSAGKGLVFSANRGDNSDVFDIRVGCDFKFESKRWYHVALSRDVYLDVLNNTVNDWRWLVDGREQPIKLTGGSYDNTIADHNDGRLVIGAPSVDVEHQNIMSTSVSGLTVDGDVVDIASPVKTDQLELTLEPGVSAGEFIVNLNNPVRGSDYTMQQIETASVNDLVEIYFKDVSNSWELVASHSTTTGHNIIAEALPAGWRTKDIHSIKWVYTPPVGSGGYLNLQHVEFRRVNNPIDWLIQYTSRSYYTQPLKGYMDQIRIVTDQSVYRGNFVVPLSAHESCNLEPADPCADVLLHIQSDDTIDTDPIQDVSGNDHTITKHGDTKHSSAETILGASSLYFDGNGDYLKIDDASSFDFNTYFTIEFWYYRESIVNPGDIDSLFSFESSNVHTPGAVAAECYIQPSDGHVYFQIACTDYTFPRIGVDVPSQTWVHIAVTRKSNDLYMFKDGQNVRLARGQSASLDLTGQTANSTAGKYMTIGGRQNLNLSNMYINDFRCTGTALYTGNFTLPNTLLTNCCPDPEEPACGDVLLHIQSDDTNPTGWMGDISQYSRTTYNDPAILADDPTHSTTNPVVGSSSLYFDGSDWIGVPHFNDLNLAGNEFTLEFWINFITPPTTDTGGTGTVVMSHGDGPYSSCGWMIYGGNANHLSFHACGAGASSWNAGVQILNSIDTDRWYHVAIVRSSGTLTSYVDGVKSYQHTLNIPFKDQSLPLIIGHSNMNTRTYFNGYLQDIRLSSTPVYTCNFTPPGLHSSCT